MGTQPNDDVTAPAGSPYEMRLALVLNGGVSLAVWMGGVTAEIDRMRRAAYPALIEPGEVKADPVLERWQHLLGRLGVRLNVDVIAGASAGGLNGAVLATAIARGKPLPELQDTWHSVGSIENLASNADQPAGDRRSILNGSLLTKSVGDVFAALTNRPEPAVPPDLRERLRHEEQAPRGVTLFTTATSMRGQAERFTDSTNQRFPQVEYRVVCRFRRPLLGPDEFNDESANDRLTRAARASASFPAAFEPTFFRAGKEVDGRHSSAEQVCMQDTAGIEESRWMVDGGVLDNEPFAPVLDRIARRAITRDVDRIVAYIDPEDASAPHHNDDINLTPGMIETVSAALNLPRETNLLNQLHRLGEMERDIAVRVDTDAELLESALAGDLDAAADALRDIYCRRRDEAVVHEVRLLLESGRPPDDPSVPVDEVGRPAAAGAPDGEWPAGITVAERVLRLALNLTRTPATNGVNTTAVADALFDLSVALIQLAQLRLEVLDAVRTGLPCEPDAAISDAKILAALGEAMTPERRAQVATIVATALRTFVAAGVGPKPPDVAAGDLDAQRAAFVAACEKIEVVCRCAAPIGAYHPVPRFRFCRFGANVGTPFFSGGAVIEGKLMGLRLKHFGGFLRSEWRDYDWMWGRLDGATHLVRMLLARLDAQPALPQEQLREDLREWVGRERQGRLDAALTAYLASPAHSAEVVEQLTGELVRPFHRAIFCSTFALPATASDADITAHLEATITSLTAVEVTTLADSEDGRKVIGQLGAAGLRALGDDAALPAQARLRPVLRVGADAVLADTQPGAKRTAFRTVYIALVVALALAPFVLHWVVSGYLLAALTTACGLLLGVLLSVAILVLPKRGAGYLQWAAGLVRVWPVNAALKRIQSSPPPSI